MLGVSRSRFRFPTISTAGSGAIFESGANGQLIPTPSFAFAPVVTDPKLYAALTVLKTAAICISAGPDDRSYLTLDGTVVTEQDIDEAQRFFHGNQAALEHAFYVQFLGTGHDVKVCVDLAAGLGLDRGRATTIWLAAHSAR